MLAHSLAIEIKMSLHGSVFIYKRITSFLQSTNSCILLGPLLLRWKQLWGCAWEMLDCTSQLFLLLIIFSSNIFKLRPHGCKLLPLLENFTVHTVEQSWLQRHKIIKVWWDWLLRSDRETGLWKAGKGKGIWARRKCLVCGLQAWETGGRWQEGL